MIWESNECSTDRAHTVSLQPLFYAFSVKYVTIIAGQCTHILTNLKLTQTNLIAQVLNCLSFLHLEKIAIAHARYMLTGVWHTK